MATVEQWVKLKKETAFINSDTWRDCVIKLEKAIQFIIDEKIKEEIKNDSSG